jgi:TPR repeat protein
MRGLRAARAIVLAALVSLGGGAMAQLRIVPDDDPDLARGWAAYQARDLPAAFAYFRKAAEGEQRVAQFNLAVMLMGGEGVVADPQQGVTWLRRAADNGLARAQF